MTQFRDFDAMLRERSGGRPEFLVGGQKFTCRSKLTWRKLSALLVALQEMGDPTTEGGMKVAEKFFSIVLLKSDSERFMELLHKDDDEEEDDEAVISFDQVMDLLDWLMEYYTGKSISGEMEKPEVQEAVKAKVVSLTPKVADAG